MSIKDTLKNMQAFMASNPSYRPSKLIVNGNPEHVLRTLKKCGLSQSLTLNGIPIECNAKKEARS